MVVVPNAIIMINNDLVPDIQSHLIKQLYITEIMDGYVFDDQLNTNTNFLSDIQKFKKRIMVIRNYTELDNRTIPDVVIFVKHGMAAVLKNNFGPHAETFPIIELTWSKLGIF